MTDHYPSTLRLKRLSRILAGVFFGGLFGLVVGLVVYPRFVGPPPVALLTSEQWRQSRDRWASSHVKNYDIRIAVTGRQAANYAVDVRDGEVIRATRDEQPLPQRRTWGTWSVEGMFETIARDLESVEKHAAGRGDSGTPHLQLHATFHPEFGFPEHYLRTEFVRFSPNREVSWTVTSFTVHKSPVDGQSTIPSP